jgi:hypothetical protein
VTHAVRRERRSLTCYRYSRDRISAYHEGGGAGGPFDLSLVSKGPQAETMFHVSRFYCWL